MADTEQPRDKNMREFMRAAYAALSKGDLRRLEKLVAETSVPADPDAALAALTPGAWANVVRSEQSQERQINWRYVLVAVAGAAMLIYLCASVSLGTYCVAQPDRCHQVVVGTYTPTVTPSQTPILTATPSPAFAPPPRGTPTATPIPSSIYLVSDPASLYPRVPLDADAVWLLNDQNVTAQPPLVDTAVWKQTTSADKQANQESFFYTESGDVTVTWTLDVPLNAGLYQLYILDTAQRSAGAQEFAVLLDDTPATPYRGQSNVIFNTAQFGGQTTDDWLPLGAYEVGQRQRLAVQASVGVRLPDAPFALDRLLITKVSDIQRQLLDALPQGRVLVSLLDDDRATFSAIVGPQTTQLKDEYQGQIQTDAPAWNGSFRNQGQEIWAVAGNAVQVDWAPVGRLPVGRYELYVWVPAQHATIGADYALVADGKPVPRDSPARIRHVDFPGAWVSLGIWELGSEAAMGVRMTVEKQDGEIGVDAVALVRVSE